MVALAVAASYDERIQILRGLLEVEFHFSVFGGMFFLGAAGVDEEPVWHANNKVPFIRRHAAKTERSTSLGKRGRPAFGGKVESVGGKSQRAFLSRSRM